MCIHSLTYSVCTLPLWSHLTPHVGGGSHFQFQVQYDDPFSQPVLVFHLVPLVAMYRSTRAAHCTGSSVEAQKLFGLRSGSPRRGVAAMIVRSAAIVVARQRSGDRIGLEEGVRARQRRSPCRHPAVQRPK